MSETSGETAASSVLTPGGRSVLIRNCEGLDELDACVRMQGDVWGYEGNDLIPRRGFVVARQIGGQVVGAFDEAGALVGFAMALPGVKPDPLRPYLHSHMLAVDPSWRNEGIGQRLKLFQREEALGRGIRLMEWTFDPLEGKNAFLNLHRLGVVVRAYLPDFYGVSSSRLQNNLPTDRLLAEWHLDSDHVRAILQGDTRPNLPIEETIMISVTLPTWKTSGQTERARDVQQHNRLRFEQAFRAGLAVVNFRRDPDGNGIYELAVWPR